MKAMACSFSFIRMNRVRTAAAFPRRGHARERSVEHGHLRRSPCRRARARRRARGLARERMPSSSASRGVVSWWRPRSRVTLGLELDAVVVRKLGAADHEEYAVGAIADGVRIVDARGPALPELSPAGSGNAVEAEERDELRVARRLRRAQPRLTGRTAIVVDDGMATGATAAARLPGRARPWSARIVLAVPVAPVVRAAAGRRRRLRLPAPRARLLGGRPVLRRLRADER